MKTLKNFLKDLENKEIHVVGASGTEGSEIAIFLSENNIKNIVLHDFCTDLNSYYSSFESAHKSQVGYKAKFVKFKNLSYKQNLRSTYLQGIEKADLIFVPQSWYIYKANKILHELKGKIPFSTLTKLYLEYAQCPVVGITGSNGKSTTTFLIHHIVSSNKDKISYLTGNDRQSSQILSQLDAIKSTDVIISEISNRQLVDITSFSPHIAVLTNISENHLAEHASYQEYIDTKAKITMYQSPLDYFIYNLDNEHCQVIASKSKAKKLTFSGIDSTANAFFDQDYLYLNQVPIIKISEFPLPGRHNLYNAAAAILVTDLLNTPIKKITSQLKTFLGLPNRIQKIAEFNGLTFYNDRQGTAIDATVKALEALKDPITLIVGGQNKGMHILPLIKVIESKNVRLIGIDSPFTQELLQTINLEVVATLTEAVNLSLKTTFKPVNILFSPACEYGPYFNPLPGYEDAENFTEIVYSLVK